MGNQLVILSTFFAMLAWQKHCNVDKMNYCNLFNIKTVFCMNLNPLNSLGKALEVK